MSYRSMLDTSRCKASYTRSESAENASDITKNRFRNLQDATSEAHLHFNLGRINQKLPRPELRLATRLWQINFAKS